MRTPPLDSNGFVIIDDFLAPEDCERLLAKIGHYRRHNGLAEISRPMKDRSLRYSVIDGERIRAQLASVWELYRGAVNQKINELAGASLEPLQNIKAGVNVNVMPPGRSEYRWHYDRTAVTAILYLNKIEGGETELYPNYRILLNGKQHSRVQLTLDRFLQPSGVRWVFGKKQVVEPHPGRLVVIRGNRCWHSVRGVEGSEDRISIILAYDAPDAQFGMDTGLDSYLYTDEKADTKDPNYAP